MEMLFAVAGLAWIAVHIWCLVEVVRGTKQGIGAVIKEELRSMLQPRETLDADHSVDRFMNVNSDAIGRETP